MLDKSIKNNSSNVKIDKRPKDPKKNPYGKDKPYINNLRVDNNGMWDPNNRNQPIMVMGNSMSTEGYGNMPLYVQPNGGNRGFVVPPNVGTINFGPNVSHFVETPMMQEGGNYNTQRALELGYQPDETGHWPSVDDKTGMWLKSKQHPTAWMEYLYGYALNPEVQRQFRHPVINPEGYFGNDQLQYLPKEAYGGLPTAQDGTIKWKPGPVSQRDSVQNMALNTMLWEKYRGDEYGYGLDNYGNKVLQKELGRNPTQAEAVNWYMNNIYPQLGAYPTAMEKASAGDFLYNTGKPLLNYVDWDNRKNDPLARASWEKTKKNLSVNDRRVALNNARDRYYQNIERGVGSINEDLKAYYNTWYGRQHATDQYKPRTKKEILNEKDKDFYPVRKAYGGDPSLTNITGHYKFGGKFSKTETHMKTGGWLDKRQNGGSRLQSSSANVVRDFEGGSYFDPVTDTIYLNSIRGDFDLPHELYHRQQYMEGRLRIPEADPYGEVRVRPSMLEEQSLIDYPYFNRREVDRDILTQDFFHGTTSGIRNPSFNMIPYDMVYDKAINPAMYHEPWTAEGEAELTGTLEGEQELIKRGIGPNYNIDDYYRHGGFLHKAQDGFRMNYGNLRKPVKEVASTTRVANNFNLPKKSDIIDPRVTAERRRKEEEANRAAIAAYVQPKKMAVEKIGSAEYIDRRGYPVSVPETYIDSVDVPNIVSYNELANPELSQIPEREIMKTDAELAQRQSKTSKASEVFWNPFTAAKYVVNNQRIPDNFSQGETSDSDIMTLFNPIHGAAFTLESLYNLGKAAFDPNTYRALGTIAQSGVAPGTVGSNEYMQAIQDISGPAAAALFTRMGYKQGKKYLNKLKAQTPTVSKPNITGKMEGLGTKADAVIPTSKRYGPIATPVFEGKYPAQSPTGNIKGDLFDLRNTGYTDIPGFNKQVQDLKRRVEFGVRPLEYKLPSQKDMRGFTDDLINKSRGVVTDFGVSADELRDLQLKRFSGKDAFKMIEPNKRGGQIGLKKRKGTSQNVQSSINDIMMRNELIFGPPGKRRFIPYKQDGGESDITGGWLDNYV